LIPSSSSANSRPDVCSHLVLSRPPRDVYSRLRSPQGSHLPSGYRPFPDADVIAHRTQSPSSLNSGSIALQHLSENSVQPLATNFMALFSIAASDVTIRIPSALSVNSLPLLSFSTAHTTHPNTVSDGSRLSQYLLSFLYHVRR
jgi:hypothetical protein